MDDQDLLAACQPKMKTDSLRPGQGEVIRTLQSGNSCLAVMPTGGGKSLLWLLTTHILNNQFINGRGQRPLTLVVVPYKALILSHLQESAHWFNCISSEDSLADIQSRITNCSVIYFTPEKFVKNLAFQEILVQNASRVQIVAIDEVHLLLEHQRFRPDLGLCINTLHSRIPQAVRLALTATSRICDSDLLLATAKMPKTTKIVRCKLDRSNCFISVGPMIDKKDKQKRTKFEHDHQSIFNQVNIASKPRSIIYVSSRAESENLSSSLQKLCTESSHLKYNEIAFFHADLPIEKKREIMESFENTLRVVVATTAFGTGINYPDIRIIIHYGLPSSLTEWLQNIGRGGRDGAPYKCVLYFSYKNIHEQGSVWMQGCPSDELPLKWEKFSEMIRFVFSTKCRRAFILPYFDDSYDASLVCNSCDTCALSDDAEARIDIQAVARILLKVIQEFQFTYPEGVVFSRIKDVITCHGLTPKLRLQQVDTNLMHRGIGVKSGFTQSNKAIWSMAVNYLLYSDNPLILEKVSGEGISQRFLIRKLVLSQAGTDWLSTFSQGPERPLFIRHPVELLHCNHAEVQAQFFPQRSMSVQAGKDKPIISCSAQNCDRPVKAHGLCQKHYMAKRREPKNDFTSRATSPETTAASDTLPATSSLRCFASSSYDTAGSVFAPRPQRGSFTGFEPPPNHSNLLLSQKSLLPSQTCLEQECSSSSEDEDGGSIFETMIPADESGFTHAQVHEGQFYPGVTVIRDVVTDCYGKMLNFPQTEQVNIHLQHYTFPKSSPFSRFNSFSKQQIVGSEQIKKYKCLGCFVCPDSECRYRAAPRVRAMRMADKVAPLCPLHGTAAVTLIHQPCTVVFEYSMQPNEDVVLTVHGGPHRHTLPPPTRLAPSTLVHIRALIGQSTDGKTGPMQVQQRSQGDERARDQRCVAHAISKTITDIFGKELGIAGLPKVAELTKKPWVRWAQPSGTSAGDFQMVFCQLNEQKVIAAEVSKAHAGLKAKTTAFFFEDVTYAYSDHYAMTIMTESLVTGRGVVASFILMTRLHTQAYAMAFYQFMQENVTNWRIDHKAQCICILFVLVVDHADSQRNGFIEAVRMLHVVSKLRTPWSPELAQTYLKHLQGCEFHWAASVKNTAQNGNIVPVARKQFFTGLCSDMLTSENMDAFNAAAQQIRGHFPKASTWLKWWMNPLHAVLIFPAFRSSLLHQDLQEFAKNPKTTNLCESQHRNYYRYLKKLNLPLVLACVNGFKYCTQQVADSEAVETGSRPLTARDRNAIVRKTPFNARIMEYDDGVRAPVSTSEHLAQERPKRPKGTQAASAAAPMSGEDGSIEDVPRMRERIRSQGLPPNSVVQVLNDIDDDAWYMKISVGVVHDPDTANPFFSDAQYFVSNSTTKIDRKQAPQPCYIGTILRIIH